MAALPALATGPALAAVQYAVRGAGVALPGAAVPALGGPIRARAARGRAAQGRRVTEPAAVILAGGVPGALRQQPAGLSLGRVPRLPSAQWHRATRGHGS